MKNNLILLPLLVAVLFCGRAFAGSETVVNGIAGFKDSPLLPGGKWHVHDPERPQPPVVTPGNVPSDAIILFDGTDLSQWHDKKGNPAPWIVADGAMTAAKTDIVTAKEFGDIQLHAEFSEPVPATGTGQGRGNSGIFLMGRFEIQVLDCFKSQTYPDGQTSAIYGQHPPLVNACRAPGEWQTYDIVFTAPRFNPDGTLKQPAYVTIFQNGILTQNHQAFLGPTQHKQLAKYTKLPETGPIALQYHNNPVRFRNIWVRTLTTTENP